MENSQKLTTRIIFVIAIIALGVAIAGYVKTPAERKIVVTEKGTEAQAEKSEGPVYTGTSNGFVIKFENGKTFYLSGDTAMFGDMKLIIKDYYKPDVALLTIGNVFTMDSKDAAEATTWINPKYVIPYHYKTFPFLTQTPDEFVKLVSDRKAKGETKAEAIALTEGIEKEIEGVKVTWLGHGSFYFVSPTGTKMLIDPWLTPDPNTPAKFKDMSVFGKIDLILITHGHLDHFDTDDMKKIINLYNPVILSQWEFWGYAQPKMPGQYLMMNKGGEITKDVITKQGLSTNIPDNIEITMVHAEHSSSAP